VIEVLESDSLGCTIVYRVDGQHLRDNTTGAYIRHTFLYSGATACSLFMGIKNGGITVIETLNVDFVGLAYHR